jgi:hypothetical protein
MTISETVEREALDDDDELELEDEQPVADDDDDNDDDDENEAAVVDVPTYDEKALERELGWHAKAIAKALGDGFSDMEPCSACGTMGFTPVDLDPDPEVLHDEALTACNGCNGYGEVITGSRNPQHFTTTCTKCQGSGYRPVADIELEQHAGQISTAPPSLPQIPPQPVYNPQTNTWDTPSVPPPPPSYR